MIKNEFCPDWASAPGDTIVDILHERQISENEFAHQIGYTPDKLEDLLQGRATITIAIARQLENLLGASVEFWISRDYQYRQDVARLNSAYKDWLSELPIGDMIKFGWLSPAPHPFEEATACLRFFDVPSVDVWRIEYGSLQQMAAYRTSPSMDSRPGAVAAWLRQGEIEAKKIRCRTWDAKRFQESLPYIRALTREKDPARFIPELKQLCAESGVAVAIVRSPVGCRASGATRFITPNKALIVLSFRYLADDHAWFTFFHEAGHLLLHGGKSVFIDSGDIEDDNIPSSIEEQEANDFAADILIPPQHQPGILKSRVNARDVMRFARKVGVSPGIVVGQMQHLGRIRRNQLNGLKRRYKWDDRNSLILETA